MLTIALVVMVIFLFLRNLAATIIPSVAVPLSIVGTFGVMYLLGYSLNNLTLMALTISTGFVVDDAIVMIENISRFIEEGDSPMQRGAQGQRADRLHHHVADGFADRGADSAAVHERRGGPALPRVRDYAGGHHSGLGVCLADADADDVLAHSAGQNDRDGKPASTIGRRRSSTPSSPGMGGRCRWFCAIASLRCWSPSPRLWLPLCSSSWFPRASSRCRIRA